MRFNSPRHRVHGWWSHSFLACIWWGSRGLHLKQPGPLRGCISCDKMSISSLQLRGIAKLYRCWWIWKSFLVDLLRFRISFRKKNDLSIPILVHYVFRGPSAIVNATPQFGRLFITLLALNYYFFCDVFIFSFYFLFDWLIDYWNLATLKSLTLLYFSFPINSHLTL